MLSEYSRYIQMLRNGLIQNGIEFSEGVDVDLSDYSTLFKLGNKIDDILLYFRLLAVGGDENSLKGFPINLEKTNRDILNALFREEFVNSVLPDYQSLIGISGAEVVMLEGNERGSKENTTEVAIETLTEEHKDSEEHTDGNNDKAPKVNIEYVPHGILLDEEDSDIEQPAEGGIVHGVMLDEDDTTEEIQSGVSLDREVEYVPHGVMLDEEVRVSHGVMLDELPDEQDDESEEVETWGLDEEDGDEETETPWGEDEEEVSPEETEDKGTSWEFDDDEPDAETPWGEDEEEAESEETPKDDDPWGLDEEGEETPWDDDEDEEDESPWEEDEEEEETPWGDDESEESAWGDDEEEGETPWGTDDEENADVAPVEKTAGSTPVNNIEPKDVDLGDVFQDTVNGLLTRAKISIRGFLDRKE